MEVFHNIYKGIQNQDNVAAVSRKSTQYVPKRFTFKTLYNRPV